jgi:hypothetical protein
VKLGSCLGFNFCWNFRKAQSTPPLGHRDPFRRGVRAQRQGLRRPRQRATPVARLQSATSVGEREERVQEREEAREPDPWGSALAL